VGIGHWLVLPSGPRRPAIPAAHLEKRRVVVVALADRGRHGMTGRHVVRCGWPPGRRRSRLGCRHIACGRSTIGYGLTPRSVVLKLRW
jgi:hypothetical protein